MKKFLISIVFIILILVVGFSGCIEETKEPIGNNKTHNEIATDFMNKLKQKEYDISYTYFSNEMKKSLPLSQLTSIWEYFISTYGDFDEIQETKLTIIDGYEVVYVNCTFTNNYILIFRIVFDVEKNITGFWQDNAILLSTYNPPNYVNTDNFSEMNHTIGASPWELPATLSIPNGNEPFPCVILVHGSGPNDRDETIGANKPFKDLAWGLATKGVAVLRYEKRTKEYPELSATIVNLTVQEEIIDDVIAAVDLLLITSKIDTNSIYIVGHSLGGMMAPEIATQDNRIAGIFLLAAPTRHLEDLFIDQTIYLTNLDGVVDESEKEQIELIEDQVQKVKTLNISEDELVLGAPKSYWIDLADYNPVETAEKLNISMLILQGERDYQVTVDGDFSAWNYTFHENENVSLKTYEKLNHLFISGNGPPNNSEYLVEGHVAEEVITDIATWIKNLPMR